MKQLSVDGAGLPVVVFMYDRNAEVTIFEGGALSATGINPLEPAARALLDACKSPIGPQHLRQALAGDPVTVTAEVDGRVLEVHHSPLRDPRGDVDLVVGVVLDITERFAAERALRERSELAKAVMDAHHVLGDLLLVMDGERIALANDALCEALGYKHAELMTLASVLELVPADERDALAELLRTQHGARFPLVFERADGARVEVCVAIERYPSVDRERVVLLARQVTTRAATDDDVLYDALTGLPNRALFRDRVAQAILAARRDGESLSVLVLEVAGDVADALLRMVSQRLQTVLGECDTLGRVERGRFAALLPATDRGRAAWLGRRLIGTLAAPFTFDGAAVSPAVDVGIALFPEHGEDGEMLLHRATLGLGLARGSGGAYAYYAEEHDPERRGETALFAELHRGIENDELVVHYQPLASMRSCHVTGVEALARWQHPERGLLPPATFIPLAERTGLVKPLFARVLATALAHCRDWRHAGRDMSVAVNVSMRNLLDPELPETVRALLEAWQVPPAALRLEITESLVMTDPDRVARNLARLREIGVALAIDDLGARHPWLSYLQRLPVHQIKIDKSVVSRMTNDRNAAAIVRSTIELGHALGLEVVTEGVEDRATWDVLARMGCDLVQGYYVSRPLPLDEIGRWLDSTEWTRRASA